MDTAVSVLPGHYDINYIIEKANVVNHYGFIVANNEITFKYRATDYDRVQDAINAYPVEYANEKVKPQMLEELAAIRWQHSQRFVYDGVETWAQAAVSDITAAVVSMQVAADPNATIPWKLATGQWRLFDFAALVAYGQAVRTHVQACFTKEESLATQIMEADDVDALALIDLESGWPA